MLSAVRIEIDKIDEILVWYTFEAIHNNVLANSAYVVVFVFFSIDGISECQIPLY